MIEFEGIIAVINPESSQAPKIHPRLENIRAHYPVSYTEITTSIDSDETVDRITAALRPGMICLSGGGDGTERDIVQALVLAESEVPLVPLWGGNGNDKAHMLNGWPPPVSRTHELLKRGEAVPINPIQISISGLKEILASNYAGFGATAVGAHLLNQKSYRRKPGYTVRSIRAVYEATALAPTALHPKSFTYTLGQSTRTAVDITFANGNRMAKYGRPRAELTKPEIFQFSCDRPDDAPEWMARLVTGRSKGNFIHNHEHYIFQLGQTVLAHADAEPFEVPEGATVDIRLHPQPFYALSTRYQ